MSDNDLLDDLDDLDDQVDQQEILSNNNSYPALKYDKAALKELLAQISKQLERPPVALLSGSFEDDIEYSLIVQANTLTIELDTEILVLFKFIRDKYAMKFPELEQSLPNPIEYAKTVKAIGNETEITKVDLSHLPNHIKLIITVTATTTKGVPLDVNTLSNVQRAVDEMLDLESAQTKILEYVESRMMLIAPNLSAIVGTGTAAKLIAIAGGLTALSKIPGCNIQVMGKSATANVGLGSAGTLKHAGFIYYSELCSSMPVEHRQKVAKLCASKCALAARIDTSKDYTDGSFGKGMRADIEKKITAMTDAAPGKTVKALPVPDEQAKKRRAGKRVRREKDRVATTELRKQQNRMAFGEQEAETGFGDSVTGLGMVGKQTGKLRVVQADTRVKGHINKKQKALLANTSSASISGIASSLAFTPVQGIELGNPELFKKKVEDANNRWFHG